MSFVRKYDVVPGECGSGSGGQSKNLQLQYEQQRLVINTLKLFIQAASCRANDEAADKKATLILNQLLEPCILNNWRLLLAEPSTKPVNYIWNSISTSFVGANV